MSATTAPPSEITYASIDDPHGSFRFRQLKSDPLPAWATDVQPVDTPCVVQLPSPKAKKPRNKHNHTIACTFSELYTELHLHPELISLCEAAASILRKTHEAKGKQLLPGFPGMSHSPSLLEQLHRLLPDYFMEYGDGCTLDTWTYGDSLPNFKKLYGRHPSSRGERRMMFLAWARSQIGDQTLSFRFIDG